MKYSKSSAFAAFLASLLPLYTVNTAFSQEAKIAKPDATTVQATEVTQAAPVPATPAPAVNAPNIDAIDAQEIEEGGKFEDVNLKEYVSDEDDKVSQLKWSISGYKDLKVTVAGGKLKVKTPNKNWNGRETIILQVSDPAGNTATGSVDYVVNSVNDIPVIKQIKGQKIKEGAAFKEIKLDDFITDEDHKDSQISWSAEVETINGFRDEDLEVVITKDRVAQIKAPNAEWYGKAKVLFTAADLDGEEVSSTAEFEVTSVNDKPVLSKIPAQKIQEGGEFSEVALDDFVKDPDHELDALKWKVSGAKELKVNLDASSRTLTIQTPDEDWAGKPEKIKIEVEDPEGGKDNSTLVLSVESVNDEPVLGDIEGQDIQEGQEFKEIDLAKIVQDKDHKLNELKWTFRGNKDLKVQIGSDRKAKIKIPNENWHGSESIVFVVTDPAGARAETEATFSVESINDKPQAEGKLKSQKIKEGKQFVAIDLDKLVKDEDHSDKDITWEAELETTKSNPQDTELSVSINSKRQAVISIPDENYFGAAKLKLTASDPDGDELKLSADFEVSSVNDLPQFMKISDQAISEGGTFEPINLADFISDIDHPSDKMKFSAKGNKKLNVKIDGNIASVTTPDEEFSGNPETITFEAKDPEGGKATIPVKFTVTSINDAPVLKKIANQTIKEGGKFAAINLDEIVSDKDHKFNNLKWSFPGKANLKVVAKGKKATIKLPHENWYGEETITAKVTDPEGASAETSFTLKVESVNDLPELKKIKGQKIKEGEAFKVIDLDPLVSDEDHKKENLVWTADVDVKSNAAKGKPTVSIDANRKATITVPNKNWNGAADITFTVTDADGGKATQKASFEVKSVNDKPVLKNLPKLTINEGESFEEINLDNLVEDLDHNKGELKWDVKGGKELKFNINQKTRMATISIPSKEWEGKPETFTITVTDPEGGKASEKVTATVKAVNDAPVLSTLKAIKVKEGDKLEDIDLKSLVKDVDNKFNELKWSFTGAKSIKTKLSGSKLKLTTPGKEWNGAEQITVTVTDPAGAKASQVLDVSVASINDLPVVSKIKDIKAKEGDQLTDLDLNSLVSDIDHKDSELTWDFNVKHKGPQAKGDLKIEVAQGKAKLVTPNSNWYGAATVSYTVKDPAGGKASGSFNVDVKSVNDKPVLKTPANQTIKEGESFASFNLDDLIDDVETSDSKIKWSVKGGKDIQLQINNKKRTVSMKTPGKEYAGNPETFTLTAEDADGAKVSAKFTLQVQEVNDAPVIGKLKGQSIKEGGKFETIDLAKFVTDVDHKGNQLKWTATGQKDIKVDIKGSKVKLSTPNKEWSGSESVTFTVTDAAGAKASKTIDFKVKSVNDLPVLKKIKGQKVKEGESLAKIDLRKLTSDADHSLGELKWTSNLSIKGQKKSRKKSKAPQPKVVIDDNGLASVLLPSANYNGAFDVTFTVTDPEGGKASQTASYEIKSVNDKPVLKGFTSQTIQEGEKFKSVSLSDKVSDADHSTKSIKWEFKGNKKLKVSIDRKKNLIVTTPSKEWSGLETISLTAVDPEGGKATIKLNYKVNGVNDLPVIKGLKGQTVKEGAKFTKIKLDDFVSDADHADKDIKWTISGGTKLKAKLSSSRVLDIAIPGKDWNGPKETFTLTATDPAGGVATQDISFEVKSVNDKPEIKKIKGQKIKEGEKFSSITLDQFIKDADHSLDEIKWKVSVSPKSTSKKKRRSRKKSKAPTIKATVSDSRVVTIETPSADWHGAATITFTATDGAGAKVSTSADFEVSSVNDLPVLKGFKSQTIKEGEKFKSVSLTDKVSDADHSSKSIKWSFKGNKKLKVSIDRKKNLIVQTPNKDWSGEERIILEAKDSEGGSAKIALVYKATEVNDLPKIAKIKSQKVKEGEKFTKIKLDNFVNDADNKDNEIKWTITGAKDLKASVNSSRTLIVEAPNKEWSGKETLTLTATDPQGASASTKVTFTMVSVNDAPSVKNVANQTIREGQIFKILDLNKYVSDADHKSSEITWYFSDKEPTQPKKSRRRKKSKGPSNGDNLGKNELQVELNDKGVATITIPNEDWNGKETIYFIARDPAGAESFTKATFSVTPVNDEPKLMTIPNQVVDEGKSFQVIKLDNYVNDPDHPKSKLKWFYKTPKSFKAKLNKSKRTLTVTAPSKTWSGSETIALRVKDPKGGQAETKVMFKVNSVNDKPVISKLPTMKVKEGKDFPVVDLNKYVKDPDHEDRRLVWSIEGGASLKAKVSFDNKLSIIALSPSWSGTEKFKLSVRDPEGATDTYNFSATVVNVNDAPKGNRDNYSVDEGKTLKVPKSRSVLVNDTDEDGPTPRVAILKKKPKNGTLKFKKDGSFIYTPKKGYSGTDRFTYQAMDKQKAKSKETIVEIKVYFKMKDIRKKK